MIKLLAVCGNGMGTSTMMKLKAKKILDSHKIDCVAENCSIGQAKSVVNNYDIVIASTHLISQLKAKDGTVLVALKNIMDAKEMEAQMLAALKK